MKNYFIPIDEIGLVEFLSSGFIGISTSRVDYEDIHTRQWPNMVVVKKLEDSPLPICCEVETKGRAYSFPAKMGSKSFQLYRIKSALSINNIKRIHFPSEEFLKDFISKYHYMSDLDVDSFQLLVSNLLLDPEKFRLNNYEDQIELVENKKMGDADKSKQKKLICDGKSIIAFAYALHCHLKINSSYNIPVLSSSDDVDVALKDMSVVLGVNLPPTGLNLLIKEYWNLCRMESIDARTDQMEIVELLSLRLQSALGKNTEAQKIVSFLDKISNVFMGMESHPNLDEKSAEKAFQFGFYISLMSKNWTDFIELRNRFRFSDQVDVIAKYLFVLRNSFSQLTEGFFKSLGANKKIWASAILDCHSSSRAVLNISAEKGSEDLRLFCSLAVNDRYVGGVAREISPEEQLVVSALRTFSVEPFRDDDSGDIAVKKYVQSNPVVITLKIVNCVNRFKLNEVHIQYKTSIKHGVLSVASTRLKILQLVSKQGVALGINEEGILVLTRLQMVDTMDRDELWHHVEQVAEGGALMEELVVDM